jgi:hypothetical protein
VNTIDISVKKIISDMDSRDLEERYFAALREKYEVYIETSSLPDRFLYLILRKADLGIPLSDIEFQYLADNLLFVTAEIISLHLAVCF